LGGKYEKGRKKMKNVEEKFRKGKENEERVKNKGK
jgi:hypothetical protein